MNEWKDGLWRSVILLHENLKLVWWHLCLYWPTLKHTTRITNATERKRTVLVGKVLEKSKKLHLSVRRELDWSERSGDRKAFQRTAWQNDVGVWVGKVCYCKELTEVFLVDAFPGKRIAMVCFLTAFTVGLLDYPNACLSAFPKSIT